MNCPRAGTKPAFAIRCVTVDRSSFRVPNEQAPGVGDGQGSLTCCSPWGRTELDTAEWLNWLNLGQVTAYSEPRLAPWRMTVIFFFLMKIQHNRWKVITVYCDKEFVMTFFYSSLILWDQGLCFLCHYISSLVHSALWIADVEYILVDMNWVEFQMFSLLVRSKYLLLERGKCSGFKGMGHKKAENWAGSRGWGQERKPSLQSRTVYGKFSDGAEFISAQTQSLGLHLECYLFSAHQQTAMPKGSPPGFSSPLPVQCTGHGRGAEGVTPLEAALSQTDRVGTDTQLSSSQTGWPGECALGGFLAFLRGTTVQSTIAANRPLSWLLSAACFCLPASLLHSLICIAAAVAVQSLSRVWLLQPQGL